MNSIKEIRNFHNNLREIQLRFPVPQDTQAAEHQRSLDTTLQDTDNNDEYNESVVEHDVDVEEEMKRINNDRGAVFKLLSMSFYEKRKTPTPEPRK